ADHRSVFAGAADKVFRKHDVFVAAHEADRNIVDTVLEGEDEVDTIFRRERWHTQLNAGQINAFVLAKRAAVHDLADHLLAANVLDTELDQPVRQQNAIAAMNFAGKRAEYRADARRVTQNAGSGDDEFLAGAKQYRRCTGQGA